MAENKNSFLLYRDIIHTVKKLSNEDAGQLFKHILSYVNDENPITDNLIVEISFEPIKQSLKRDLKRYEEIVNKRKLAGLASAESRKQNQQVLTSVESVQQTSTNSTDSVSDSVSVIDSDIVLSKDNYKKNINKGFDFKKSLIKLGITEQIVTDWLIVRKTKKASNTETAFNKIKREIEKSKISANECIRIAAEKNWIGFESDWLKNIKIEGVKQKTVLSI